MKLRKVSKLNPKEILRKSCCDRLHKDLENEGVTFFNVGKSLNIDKDYLSLPQNITEVSNRELGEYLNAFTQQKVYMRTLLGFAEMYVEESRRDYVTASSGYFSKLLNSKLSETAKEREVNSSESVAPYYEEYLDCKNKVRLLQYNIDSIEDIIFMLSREVSRRTGDFSEESRNYNVQRR